MKRVDDLVFSGLVRQLRTPRGARKTNFDIAEHIILDGCKSDRTEKI